MKEVRLVSLQTTNSPFTEEQSTLLNQLLPTLTDMQRTWLSGYLIASNQTLSEQGNAHVAIETSTETIQKTKEVTILVGSHTGNGFQLAEQLTERLKSKDIIVHQYGMDEFKPRKLKDVELLLVIVSTHGEGDPPDNAISFYEYLHRPKAPSLSHLQFSVLALGDSSYEHFCQTGKDFDQRLEELGGKRFAPRVDCDVDFEESAANWFQTVEEKLQEMTTTTEGLKEEKISPTEEKYSRQHPFNAEILEHTQLNGRGSNKETTHIELSIEGSGFTFEPGDSVGIYPENNPELVDAILQEMNWDSKERVEVKGEKFTLREALLRYYDITSITLPLLNKLSSFSENKTLKEYVERESFDIKEVEGKDFLDILKEFGPWKGSFTDFLSALRPLAPRLYSIANSLEAYPEEVHVTIGSVKYEAHGRSRFGVCSVYCADRKEIGDTLPIYIQKNPNFRLPKNHDDDIIMIGAGTGIAPYRAFMQEREEKESGGRNWLFFGDQHYRTDFLYQVEWQQWKKQGLLTNIDLAFSRDSKEKVYVQHRMWEKKEELYDWLEQGAYVYVCGDKDTMAKDVEKTLLAIIQKVGNKTEEEAKVYVQTLREEKRYQRDVY